MTYSTCTISFFRNDLQKSRLPFRCPIKDCHSHTFKVPFQKYQVPFCPEHGLRIHRNGFVYYNGTSTAALALATKRNLMFYGDYYIGNLLSNGHKMESGRLCYENSEDAVTFNVFTELLRDKDSLRRLVAHITNLKIDRDVELYLWGGRIDLNNNIFEPYKPLGHVRDCLERDIKRFKTEPDIMLVVPGKVIVCIEAKFGSKNPVAKDMLEEHGEKPKDVNRLLNRYYKGSPLMEGILVNPDSMPKPLHEQIFRNIVFCASMAKEADIKEWYVANLRNQHLMNMRRGKPEGMPIKRNVISMLQPTHKHRFTHLTWEDIYDLAVKNNNNLSNLAWYLKNKSLSCSRAFNIF